MSVSIKQRFTIQLKDEELDISEQELKILANDLNLLYSKALIEELQRKKTKIVKLVPFVVIQLKDENYTFNYSDVKPLYKQLTGDTRPSRESRYREYTYSKKTTDQIHDIISNSTKPLMLEEISKLSGKSYSACSKITRWLFKNNLLVKHRKGHKIKYTAKNVYKSEKEPIEPVGVITEANESVLSRLRRDKELRRQQLRDK
jgi:CRISPR/Cas system endoribonuclease Cas6 (RAMP superfamily)